MRILLLSDIHLSLENLEKLYDWLQDKKYDFVFASGDLCNLPNKGVEEEFDQEEIENSTM